MKERSLLKFALSILALLGILHVVAIGLHLYWTAPWFDIGMHFLGGLMVGFFTLAFISQSKIEERVWNTFLFVISIVVVVGMCWEMYEYANGVAYVKDDYGLDTAIDMVMNIIGGTAAYAFAYKRVGVNS